MWNGLRQDLRQAYRSLKARKSLTAVVVVTLALSMGATTAIFSVVNGILLQPLPYPDAERLVNVYQTNEAWRESSNPQLRAFAVRFPLSYPIYEGWRDRQSSFEGIGAYAFGRFRYQGGETPRMLYGRWVTAELLTTLGVEPIVGRLPGPEKDRMGAEPVVLLSHGMWSEHFGNDPNVVGRTVDLNGVQRPIIGVMPPEFRFPVETDLLEIDLWITFDDDLRSRPEDSQFLSSVARLRPGVDLETARRELTGLQARMHETFAEPPEDGARNVNLGFYFEEVVGDVRATLWVLFASVAVVLVIACANIANLLFVSGLTRRREFAVRAALGAGGKRLVRSQLVEAALLATLGGGLALLLAWAIHDPLVAMLPPDIPRRHEIALDGRVFGFAFLLTALTTIGVSLLPAVLAGRTDPSTGMREGSRGSGSSRRAARIRSGLVIAEVALAFVLMVGAGLLANSYWRLNQVDIGFQPANVATFSLSLPDELEIEGPSVDPTETPGARFTKELERRLEEIPGVRDAALTTEIPMGGGTSSTVVYLDRNDAEPLELSIQMSTASASYFDVMGIRFLAGGPFDEADGALSGSSIVLNQTAAETLFPGENAVGRRVRRGEDNVLTIVGVVRDVRHVGFDQEPVAKLYRAAGAHTPMAQNWVLRTSGDPGSILDQVRQAVSSLDPDLPVQRPTVMEEVVQRSLAEPRFRTVLIGSLGLLAGLLAILGVSGVVAFVISQRVPEIGVRIALGASPRRIVRSMTGGGLRLTAIGLIIGVTAALPISGYLDDFLFGIPARDAMTFGVVLAFLLAIAGIASWWPARRAARVDPVEVLGAD